MANGRRRRRRQRRQERREYRQQTRRGRGRYRGVPRDTRRLLRQEERVSDVQNRDAVKYGNANYVTPFGGSGVTYDENGVPTYTEYMSPEQEGLYSSGVGISQDLLSGYSQYDPGTSEEQRARIEEATYGRLTRNLDRDRQRDLERTEQTLYNRGIPLDPTNEQYSRHMGAVNERYDTLAENAMARAVEMGGQEMSRDAAVNLATHQQGMSDLGTLHGQGMGFRSPSGPGYNAPNQYNYPSPADMYYTGRGQDITRYGIDKNFELGMAAIPPEYDRNPAP